MKLYSGPLSLFSRKVEIALREKGLAFEREMVAFTQAAGYAPKHPSVLAANPKGQVPVLIDGDLALFDSTLIFEYLEDAYPSPPLYPVGAKARARCRLLELTADEILLRPVVRLMYRTGQQETDPERHRLRVEDMARAEDELRAHYAKLDGQIGDAYLCGGFTVADIAMFMMIMFALRLRGPRLDAYPGLSAWYARVGARPSAAPAAAEIAAADKKLSRPLG